MAGSAPAGHRESDLKGIKEPPVVALTIAEPYPVALRMVRRALAQQGLRAPAELDVAAA